MVDGHCLFPCGKDFTGNYGLVNKIPIIFEIEVSTALLYYRCYPPCQGRSFREYLHLEKKRIAKIYHCTT